MTAGITPLPSARGHTIATVALSVLAFLTAGIAVFFVLMWGESGSGDWGIVVGILFPIAMSLMAGMILAGHFVRRRLARSAEIRAAVERELRAMFTTDLD